MKAQTNISSRLQSEMQPTNKLSTTESRARRPRFPHTDHKNLKKLNVLLNMRDESTNHT